MFHHPQFWVICRKLKEAELRREVDVDVKPHTQAWRKGVGTILKDFGLGIDYEEIMKAAEIAYDKERALREAAEEEAGQVKDGAVAICQGSREGK